MRHFLFKLFKLTNKNSFLFKSAIQSENTRKFILKSNNFLLCGSLAAAASAIFIHFNLVKNKNLFEDSILFAKENVKLDENVENKSNDEKKKGGDDEIFNNPQKKLFLNFASVEYNGIAYMTPHDFIESVTGDRLRPHFKRKTLSKSEVEQILKQTPSRKSGSSKLFRNLENKGLITYSEYLFLLCVITKSRTNFEIAFNMFDIDGNRCVDKKEFLVVTKIFQRDEEIKLDKSKKSNDNKKAPPVHNHQDENKLIDSLKVIDLPKEHTDTTLLIHLFGQKGNNVLYFNDFKIFMENLQTEILEVEFSEYSKGLNKITELEFAEIILHYTDFEDDHKFKLMNKLESQIQEYSRGISFDDFSKFSSFMNNLHDFSLAIKFHTFANKSISKSEFQRAVKVSSGFELNNTIVDVIYKIFDEDNDEKLSYKEFIAVMRDRLRRNPKTHYKNNSEHMIAGDDKKSFVDEFKSCIKKKMHSDKNLF